MNITIITDDGAVYVDGLSFSGLDLPFLDQSIHAVQWKVDKGWIEYKDNEDGTRQANTQISDFTPFQGAVDAWDAAKLAYETALTAAAVVAPEQPISNGTQTL